jgi:hypothetical protein
MSIRQSVDSLDVQAHLKVVAQFPDECSLADRLQERRSDEDDVINCALAPGHTEARVGVLDNSFAVDASLVPDLDTDVGVLFNVFTEIQNGLTRSRGH